MLGTLGASATVGLAGCTSGERRVNQSFTAPWVGMKGETFPLAGQGPRPVTLRNSETASKSERREFWLFRINATMNMKATSYNWQLEDEYSATVGFISVPIPKVGIEFAGPLDDPLNSLVTGEWGLELFNRMGFTDDPVDSVEYVRVNAEESTNTVNHPELRGSFDIMNFDVTAMINDESTEEYRMTLRRYRTKGEELPDGTHDSYVFQGDGALLETIDTFNYTPDFRLGDTDQFGFIDEPSA